MTLLEDYEQSLKVRFGPSKLKPIQRRRRRRRAAPPIESIKNSDDILWNKKPKVSQRIILEKIQQNNELERRQTPPSALNQNQEDSSESLRATTAASAVAANAWETLLEGQDQNNVIGLDDAPIQLTQAPKVDLSKWSLITSDATCTRIAMANKTRMATAAASTNKKESLDWKILNSKEQTQRQYTYYVNLNGAEKVTDKGVCALANSLEQLETLELANTKVSDAGLRLVALKCRNITRLNLSNCHDINGIGIGAITGACHYIKWFSIAGCKQIEKWILHRIFHGFPHLTHINFSHIVTLEDIDIKTLGHKCGTSIETLYLNNCDQLSDMALGFIGKFCKRLKTLQISRTSFPERISDTGLLSLAENCVMLETLDISGCSFVTDVGIRWIATGCRALTDVNVSDCHAISDTGLNALSEYCTGLKILNISENRLISNVGMRYIATTCKKLQSLSTSGLFLVSDGDTRDFGIEGMQAIGSACSALTSLNLSNCFQLVERSLVLIGKNCKLLKSLNLRGCKNVTEGAVVALAKGCSALVDLNLTSVTGCTFVSIKAIVLHLRQIQTLSVAFCSHVTDTCLKTLGAVADSIISLNLSGCEQLTNKGVNAFSEKFKSPALKHLKLSFIPQITTECIAKISYRCPDLLELSLTGCPNISKTAVKSLASSWQYTKVSFTKQKFGYFPAYRADERRDITRNSRLWLATLKIQNLYRTRKARANYFVRRELYMREKVARFLQGCWKIRKARRQLLIQKWIANGREKCAIKIQRAFRNRQTEIEVTQQRTAVHNLHLEKYAIFVQRTWRRAKETLKFNDLIVSRIQRRKEMNYAAIVVQRRWRGIDARQKVSIMRAAMEHQLEVESSSAETLQRMLRGRQARKALEEKRRQKLMKEEARHNAAKAIQGQWNLKLLAKQKQERLERMARAEAVVIKLQATFRAKKEAKNYTMQAILRRRIYEERASRKLQAMWKHKQANYRLNIRFRRRAAEIKRKVDAAVKLQRFIRHRIEWNEYYNLLQGLLKEKREEEAYIFWAAQLIQKRYRGVLARRLYASIYEEAHKESWKEMVDVENSLSWGAGALYYYNQINQESIRRMPIVWRAQRIVPPKCDQCEMPEAAKVECAECQEFFCHDCHNVVHGGGKRQFHNFRICIDFYGEHQDFGEGEFPSIWPMEQYIDSLRGYDFENCCKKSELYDKEILRIQRENREREELKRIEAQRVIDEKEAAERIVHEANEEKRAVALAAAIEEHAADESVKTWVKAWDEENECPYYFDNVAEYSTYTRPAGYESPESSDTDGEEPVVRRKSSATRRRRRSSAKDIIDYFN